jgi:hypothetical protein
MTLRAHLIGYSFGGLFPPRGVVSQFSNSSPKSLGTMLMARALTSSGTTNPK